MKKKTQHVFWIKATGTNSKSVFFSHCDGCGKALNCFLFQFQQLLSKETEISELKSKFLKHRQILVSNYEQAEGEIRRLDELYHDTVEQVLGVSLRATTMPR